MPWNKGFTKNSHPSVMKISQTMRNKYLDNFKKWRDQMKNLGKIPNDYPSLSLSQELAEYIGVVLGDGHIERFSRTERIIICGNANNPGFIRHYSDLTKKLFNKKPVVKRSSKANVIRISLYQKEISSRLGIPSGNRKYLDFKVPEWIWKEELFVTGFLRGLFEAEGSLSIHIPSCTYNFQFSNRNQSLLNAVIKGLQVLGYHPEIRKIYVRLRKKREVEDFRERINFRKY